MRLSIVIVYFGNKDFPNVLESIYNTNMALEYEIIVVNNHSKEWNNLWEKRFEQVKFIHLPYNAGFGKANNIGVRYAKGEYVLFLNPDTIIKKGSIEKLLKCFEENNCSVAGPKLIYPDGELQYSVREFPNLINVFFSRQSLLKRMFPNNKITKKVLHLDMDYNVFNEVNWLMGAALLIKKKLFIQLKGFDERFFLFLEDTDLQYRIKRQSGKICYCANSIIIHNHGTTMNRFPFRARFYHHVSMYKYFIKRGYDNIWQKSVLFVGAILHLLFESIIMFFRRWIKR